VTDLISRQAAIDAALTFIVEYCGAAFDEDMQKMLCERLDALPSAEPQWIPVSEKLPKYSDSVLVSLFDHEIDIGSYYCDTWHINGCGSVEDGAVLAWMHLPKPYEGNI
jgi:hypothetical protein